MTETATSRMTRLVGFFSVVVLYVYLGIYSPIIVRDFPHNPVWSVVALAGELAIASLLLYFVFTKNARAMRYTSFAWTAAYLIAAATWPLCWSGYHYELGEWNWHHSYMALAIIVVLPYISVTTTAVAVVFVFPLVHLTSNSFDADPLMTSIVNGYTIGGFCVLIPWTLLVVARRHDELARDSEMRAATAAAAEAEAIERERIDGLIHDSVMSTLLTASRVGSQTTVVSSADHALDELAVFRGGAKPEDRITSSAFLGLARSSLHFVDPQLTVTVEDRTSGQSGTLPHNVVRTIVAASTETLRNSLRHAGRCTRVATITLEGDETGGTPAVEITIGDNGVGFDPHSVRPTSLGLKVSIVGRMNALSGGSAEVESQRGIGTVVTLRWSPP